MNYLYDCNIILCQPLISIQVLKLRIWYILIPQKVTKVNILHLSHTNILLS